VGGKGERLIDTSYRDGFPVDLPGGSVVLVRRGSGPPVLLLHGIPLSLVAWRHNIGPLAHTATVLAVDLRGFGRSDKPPDADYSVPAQARMLAELLDRLALPAVSVVGSSYGCAVALTLAHLAPERVVKLVLINPVCYPQGRHSATRLARIGLVAALARPALRTSALGRRMMAGPLRRSYARPGLATPELVDTYHELLTRQSGERAYLAALRQLDEAEVARRVPEVEHEALIIWGARDRVLPATDAHRLTAELRGSRLEVLPDAGHFPHEETPEQVNSLIAAFLAGNAVPRAPSPGPDLAAR
jgi:pimeloyl-ACP methyl ester carboxylesterase